MIRRGILDVKYSSGCERMVQSIVHAMCLTVLAPPRARCGVQGAPSERISRGGHLGGTRAEEAGSLSLTRLSFPEVAVRQLRGGQV